MLLSDRAPMEGDFYARGGETSFAYDSGVGSADGARILAPDTESVPAPAPIPEPGTLARLEISLLGIAARGRKRLSNSP